MSDIRHPTAHPQPTFYSGRCYSNQLGGTAWWLLSSVHVSLLLSILAPPQPPARWAIVGMWTIWEKSRDKVKVQRGTSWGHPGGTPWQKLTVHVLASQRTILSTFYTIPLRVPRGKSLSRPTALTSSLIHPCPGFPTFPVNPSSHTPTPIPWNCFPKSTSCTPAPSGSAFWGNVGQPRICWRTGESAQHTWGQFGDSEWRVSMHTPALQLYF